MTWRGKERGGGGERNRMGKRRKRKCFRKELFKLPMKSFFKRRGMVGEG
jgi:hypothetical protein